MRLDLLTSDVSHLQRGILYLVGEGLANLLKSLQNRQSQILNDLRVSVLHLLHLLL
jgi:hypothetical protein